MNEPIVFEPIYQERVWGGRVLESRYRRALPREGVPFGESWEVSDREEAGSLVASGPEGLAGRSLGALWTEERAAVFGDAYVGREGPFPLLLKILDACDRLSIQVHPPAAVAPRFAGEPKTEMWYIAKAEENAVLYVGLKCGVSKESFERGILAGQTEEQMHRIAVETGEFIFIPSGRLHAIGAGLTIFEIQENSDTTYRVFDWNRMGLNGIPRNLHVEQSLECINFDDVEPEMGQRDGEVLVNCLEFGVEEWAIAGDEARIAVGRGAFSIVTVVEGRVACGSASFSAGDSFLVPADAVGAAREVWAESEGARVLRTTLPS